MTEKEREVAEKLMPGPLTLVVDGTGRAAPNLNEDFAFRVPDLEIARQLARSFPVTATSANISSESTSYSVEQISPELLDDVEAVVDRGDLGGTRPSTILEFVDGEPVVHREGPVTLSEIREAVDG